MSEELEEFAKFLLACVLAYIFGWVILWRLRPLLLGLFHFLVLLARRLLRFSILLSIVGGILLLGGWGWWQCCGEEPVSDIYYGYGLDDRLAQEIYLPTLDITVDGWMILGLLFAVTIIAFLSRTLFQHARS